MKELQAIVQALTPPAPARDSALATLVSVEGSSYRRPGARLLIRPDGTRVGSISGGCLEEDVLARAQRVLATGVAETVVYDTTSENDLVWGVGLGCHGIVRVLIEKLPPHPPWAAALARNFAVRRPTEVAVTHEGTDPSHWGTRLAAPGDCPDPGALFLQTLSPPTRFVIFGAGDDARPLAQLAYQLGWDVTVADPRPAFATAARFPTARTCIAAAADELARKVYGERGAEGAAVVMTHHYIHDVPLLRTLLPRPLAYLGLLGPRKRAAQILEDLAADGFVITPDQRSRLHAPVGLDLGADGPEEVALAIVAEIQATLAGRNAQALRDRTLPIHEVFAAQKP